MHVAVILLLLLHLDALMVRSREHRSYDDASWSSVHLCHLVVHAFVVARLSHHLIGSLVALHAGIVQPRREPSTARPLKVLVVLCVADLLLSPSESLHLRSVGHDAEPSTFALLKVLLILHLALQLALLSQSQVLWSVATMVNDVLG